MGDTGLQLNGRAGPICAGIMQCGCIISNFVQIPRWVMDLRSTTTRVGFCRFSLGISPS